MFSSKSLLITGMLMCAAACGAQDAERDAPAAIAVGKDDVPGWFRHLPLEVGCGTMVADGFVGVDSAHLFSFPGEAGRELTLDFDPRYTRGRGAGIAIYDAETGEQVAGKVNLGSKANLHYTPVATKKYLVGVYSVSWEATGSYMLSATCADPLPRGEIRNGEPRYTDAGDGMECAIPTVYCVSKDSGACPQYLPPPPDWCKDGTVQQGPVRFSDSSDGMKCATPSLHCVTKDRSKCPVFSSLPPNFCEGGTVEFGSPVFTDAGDGMECARPTVHCVTNDKSQCPALTSLPPNWCPG